MKKLLCIMMVVMSIFSAAGCSESEPAEKETKMIEERENKKSSKDKTKKDTSQKDEEMVEDENEESSDVGNSEEEENLNEEDVQDNTDEADKKNRDENEDSKPTVKADSWEEAYADCLKKLGKENPKAHFELAYVTADDIPELVVTAGGGPLDGVDVYTYIDNEVVPVIRDNESEVNFGRYGTLVYKKKENLIYFGDMDRGIVTEMILEVKGDKAKTKYYLSNSEGDVKPGEKIRYMENEKEITAESYRQKYEQYGFGEIADKYTVIEHGSAKEINDANIAEIKG